MTTLTVPEYIGICSECWSVKGFDTDRQRQLWETYHPHQED